MTAFRYQHHRLPQQSRLVSTLPFLAVGLLLLCGGSAANSIGNVNPESLVWEARTEFPGGGRHHPITFANATHGFVLSGSIPDGSYTSDLWVSEAATDSWTDLSSTDSAFPGLPRSYGYGVAATSDCFNTKAYVGFGAGDNRAKFADWWEFDMSTHNWKQLADFPGEGRKHPSMNFLEPIGEIHVGLGDGVSGNYKDYYSYNIENDEWKQLDDFPSRERHHPFYFAIGTESYVGMGHSSGSIERDWYRYDGLGGTWNREEDFASYALGILDATEARVAGTQFSVAAGSCTTSDKTLGFVLSGDGDNHSTMETGEFHVFDPSDGNSIWHALPPHPGPSRWAPGSFVLQGSRQAYFLAGYDREQRIFFSDLWTIDLQPLFDEDAASFKGLNEISESSSASGKGFNENSESSSASGKGFNENSESSSALPFGNIRDIVALIVAISSLALVL